MIKRAVSLLLTLCLVFSCSVSAFAESEYYTDTEADHSNVAFSDMDLSDFNESEVYDAIDDLKKYSAESGNDEKVREAFNALVTAVDKGNSYTTILNIKHYLDVSNDEKTELYDDASELMVKLNDDACVAVSDLLKTEYADIVKDILGEAWEDYEDYEEMDSVEEMLVNKETDLVNEYDELAAEDDTEYSELCDVYIELVELRKVLAELDGYDSYMEAVYQDTYGRDYSVDDVEEYRKYVKEYIVPLVEKIRSEIAFTPGFSGLYTIQMTDDDVIKILGNYVGQVSEELVPAFEYMKEYGLYDISDSEEKAEVGFTTQLYYYGVPFLFNCPYGEITDVSSAAHEFGHFNQMYHNPVHALTDDLSYDLCEVHSQGLEALFLNFSDDIFGEEYGTAYNMYEIYVFLSLIVDGALFDEFQQEAFEEKDLTEEKLSSIFSELCTEYNCTSYGEEYWAEVPHNFESPFYYISYSTSALGALEIYSLSQQDWDKAVDTYLRLSAMDPDTGFCAAMDEVGFGDMMSEEGLKSLAEELETLFDGTQTAGQLYTDDNIRSLAVFANIP